MTDGDPVAVEEVVILDVLAVHADRILAADVLEKNGLTVEIKCRVLPRDERILQDDGVLLGATDCRLPLVQDIDLGLVRLGGVNSQNRLTLDLLHRLVTTAVCTRHRTPLSRLFRSRHLAEALLSTPQLVEVL